MQRTPETVLRIWLSELGIRISPALLKRMLKSHPDYPSLLSVTDTLNDLGIENLAFKIERNQLHEVSTPFLAHVKSNDGEFVIVENRDTLEKVYPGFFKNWSGVVVTAEKPGHWNHEENNKSLATEKKINHQRFFVFAVLALTTVAAIILSTTWITPALITVAAAGLFVSWMIASKDLGIENKIADQVCGKEADCDTVIHSKGSKLLFGIGWSDIGISWFTSMLLVLMLSSFAGNNTALLPLLSVLAAAAIPFTAFSVYYQWRIVKKWCRLCLMIVGLLCAQFAILLTNFLRFSWHTPQINGVFFIVLIIVLVSIAWFIIKSLLLQFKKSEDESFDGMRFKRNESVFSALLEKQRRVDFTPWENDMQLGNAAATLQIIVACNPYCRPCAITHEKLHDFIEKNADNAGLTIRLTVNANDKENKATKVVQCILQLIEHATANMNVTEKANYAREVLQHWYKTMDYDRFIEKYPFAGAINVDDMLSRHDAWIKEVNIWFTPTIFINGREKPDLYDIENLTAVLKYFNAEAMEYNIAEV
jgi:protein-disulfide isomerase/uncharacterized membrane protein